MGIAERKAREKESRRESILFAAKKLFSKKGFENTSMDELAAEAELAKGTLYLYFKSKEEVIYSLLSPSLAEYQRGLREIASDPGKPAEATLREIVKYIYDMYLEEPEIYRVIIHYKAKEYQSLLSEENFRHLRELMRGNLQITEDLIRRGVDAGVFHRTDPKKTSIILWNIFVGVMQYEENRTYNGGPSYLKPTLYEAIDLLIRGMRSA